jgi:hypothetical protein
MRHWRKQVLALLTVQLFVTTAHGMFTHNPSFALTQKGKTQYAKDGELGSVYPGTSGVYSFPIIREPDCRSQDRFVCRHLQFNYYLYYSSCAIN